MQVLYVKREVADKLERRLLKKRLVVARVSSEEELSKLKGKKVHVVILQR